MNKSRMIALALALVLSATALWAGEAGVPNRLATAKVGEWATYSVPNGYQQKLTVIKREGDGPEAQVTVRVDNIYDGQLVNSTEFVRDAGAPMEPPRVDYEPGVSVEIKRRSVTVKGRSMEATVVEVEYDYDDEDIDDEEVEWYVSAEVPVFGIIRKIEDDKTVFELVDFGEN